MNYLIGIRFYGEYMGLKLCSSILPGTINPYEKSITGQNPWRDIGETTSNIHAMKMLLATLGVQADLWMEPL